MNETNKAIELLREKLRHYKRLSLKLGLNSTSYSVNIMVKNELNDILSEIEGFENSSEKIESELGRAVKAVERLRTVGRYKQNNMKELTKERKQQILDCMTDDEKLYVVELMDEWQSLVFRNHFNKQDFEQFKRDKGLIEPELQEGEWYKVNDDNNSYLFNHQKGFDSYGFFEGEWVYDKWSTELSKWHGASVKSATDEEVQTALIKEARNRGYVEDRGDIFSLIGNALMISYNGGGVKVVFENGRWAEIV